MFDFRDINGYDDENYYFFMIESAFDLLETDFDYFEVINNNDDVIGRITIHDALYFMFDNTLVVIKDADIFDYDFSIKRPYAYLSLNEEDIHYLKFYLHGF